MPTIVLVEDDDKIAAPLVRTLQRDGYSVERFAEGRPAIDRLTSSSDVALLLLDLGLPDIDGIDVCRAVRDGGFTGGIIILTARDGELDRVVGLDQGADDYLAKPFGLAELQARTRALLRRSSFQQTLEAQPEAAAEPVADTAFRVDPDARRIWVGEEELPATPKEFDVLALLDSRRGTVLTRDTLINEVWDENWFGSTKTLDTTIGRLRQKLEEIDAPIQITTVRGVGFRLEDVEDA